MTKEVFLKKIIPAIFPLLMLLNCSTQISKNGNETISLKQTIPLPNVTGRIDHLAFDGKKQTVFIAALGNNSVEVVDLNNKKVIHSIKELHEPQGIVFIPQSNSIFVANGENGECDVFNAETFQKTNSISLGDDADNVRYDSLDKKIYVGYGSGGIAIIDAHNFNILSQIKLTGHPESFQIDKTQKKMFVNVPGEKQIEVIDLVKDAVIAQWKLTEARANFPMALDEKDNRLFVGCRHPSKLLVMDMQTGKTISSLDIDSDVDDIFYNSISKEIYLSCGGGYVDVFKQDDANHYSAIGKTETLSGARTSLFTPGLNELLVASPSSISRSAQLLIYEIK